ncbi:TIGR00730 family Rossman fold protein [Zhengella mangrovi]|uniref:Cytokinin riboside 5'-monophosphate phosphoribohydrolase n=1 Tax=Zhengella mangrovi TaxID=1982044 RepID=A0A2G1QST5_9HYPH|nr:TIGR00730 family Rossman fold protein [Zhengella mangrovi]PHP68268.1 TIGR00730 family Rossman fold protein [Zhengella mangrovi]
MTKISSICVYCGSSDGAREIYREAGFQLGQAIAAAGLRLVYGGGTRGIMGAVAEGAIAGGGKVSGIIPRFLMRKEAPEAAGNNLDELIVTETMHERKHALFQRSDAFVAMPGGIGTVEEIVEMMTWAQLGHHTKPMVFGNIGGYWGPMIEMMDHMKAEGFIHTANRVQPMVIAEVAEIVPAILAAASTAPKPAGEPAVIERM